MCAQESVCVCVFTQDAGCLDKTNSASLHPHIKAEAPLRDHAHKTVQARTQTTKQTHPCYSSTHTRALTNTHSSSDPGASLLQHTHRHTKMHTFSLFKNLKSHKPSQSTTLLFHLLHYGFRKKTQSQFNVLKILQETAAAAANKKALREGFWSLSTSLNTCNDTAKIGLIGTELVELNHRNTNYRLQYVPLTWEVVFIVRKNHNKWIWKGDLHQNKCLYHCRIFL